MNDSGWRRLYEKKGGVSLRTLTLPDYSYDVFLSETSFPLPAKTVIGPNLTDHYISQLLMLIDFLWAFDGKQWAGHMDARALSWEIVRNFPTSPPLRLCRQVQSMPWPLTNRELHFASTRLVANVPTDDGKEAEAHYLVFKSVVTPLIPRVPKLVKGDVYIRYPHLFQVKGLNNSAWVAISTGSSSCTFHRMLHVDPHAPVPRMIVNQTAENCAEQLRTLQRILPRAKL